MSPESLRLAQQCADATGKPFLFGIRPSFLASNQFVHCDGIEYDGDHEDAVRGVVQEIRRRAVLTEADARASLAEAHRVLAATLDQVEADLGDAHIDTIPNGWIT